VIRAKNANTPNPLGVSTSPRPRVEWTGYEHDGDIAVRTRSIETCSQIAFIGRRMVVAERNGGAARPPFVGRGPWPWVSLGLVLGSPVLVGGVILSWHRISMSHEAANLPGELALAKADGIPLDTQSLRALTGPVHAEDNAADLYRASFSASEARGSTNPILHSKPTPQMMDKAEDALAVYQDRLNKAVLASKRPAVDWGARWYLADDYSTDQGTQLWNVAEVLCARAVLRAKEGNVSDAVQDLVTVLRMSEHAGASPTLAGMGRQLSIQSLWMGTLVRVLGEVRPSAPDIGRLMSSVQSLHELRSVKSAFKVSVGIACVSMLKEIGEADSTPALRDLSTEDVLYKISELRRAGCAKAIRIARRCIAAMPEDNSARSTFEAALLTFRDTINEDTSVEMRDFGYRLWGETSDIPDVAGCTAERRTAMQALASLSVRLQTGKVPSALPLDGAAAIDPYTSRPLRLRIDKGIVKIYSLGKDLVDDGGVTHEEDRKRRTHDLAMSFPLVVPPHTKRNHKSPVLAAKPPHSRMRRNSTPDDEE
jgi:hypothetical protein